MNNRWQEFCLDPALTYLNHASYGVPTRQMMRLVDDIRIDLERDTALSLGRELHPRLAASAAAIADLLGASSGQMAVVANATSAASALATSLLPRQALRVVMLDLEYSSVVRAWRQRVEYFGGSLTLVPVALPVVSADSLVGALEAVPGPVNVVVLSATTSSTALNLPVSRIRDWARKRGAVVIVDAAQAGLQDPLDIDALDVDAVFGSLHKWLPVPRSVGYVWATNALAPVIRPAEVTLSFDEADLVRRFGWRGTWDPAPALAVPDAIAVWRQWEADGLLASARAVADLAHAGLTDLGLVPSGPAELRPSLLRGYLVPGRSAAQLKGQLLDAGIRAWVGEAGAHTVLRIAIHIYTSEADVHHLLGCLRAELGKVGQ